MPTWNAEQYLRFGDERTRPCRELAARVATASPNRVIDLGCGPGNSTAVLAERWPTAELTGLDSSWHILADSAAIVEWYEGTGLRPFLDALADEAQRAGFLAKYLERIQQAYPVRGDGRVIFPFRRLFMIAYQRP